MDYVIFKFFHLLSIFVLIFSYGGWIWSKHYNKDASTKFFGITSGIALIVLFLAGFSMLAVLKVSPIPLRLYAKMFIWLLIGLFPIAIRKVENPVILTAALGFLFSLPLFLVLFKPF